MPKAPLFSTYRQGENRVTSSMMAVFQRIDIGVVERLLGAASGESSLAIVTFANQVAGRPGSVPDAAITANCRFLFEVKTETGALKPEQLKAHLDHLDGSYKDERLFVLSPDASQPAAIDWVADSRVSWLSFLGLSQAIDAMLTDPAELVSEQGRFLLRELQALFAEDGLLAEKQDTVVVAAGRAWGEYLAHAAYICQPGRSFRQGITHMAFYADSEIKPRIARILHRQDQVECSEQTVEALAASDKQEDLRLADRLRSVIQAGIRPERESQQVFVLSSPVDGETKTLASVIRNAARDRNGRPIAWVYGQRYISLNLLTKIPNPETTSDLEASGG